MKPNEKAYELIKNFYTYTRSTDTAKKCAEIAVDEIIQDRTDGELDSAYWQEVRLEIYYLGLAESQGEARADKFNEEL